MNNYNDDPDDDLLDLIPEDESWEDANNTDDIEKELEDLSRSIDQIDDLFLSGQFNMLPRLPAGLQNQPPGAIYSGILKKWVNPITGEVYK